VKRPIVAATAGTCSPQPVRPAHDRDANVAVEHDRLRHGAVVEQRVPAIVHVDRRLVDDDRFDRVHPVGDGGARRREVEVDVDRDVRADLRRFGTGQRAQLGEDTRDLVLFLRAQRPHAVVRFQRLKRLDEQGLTAGARIVHDAGYLTGELRLHRHHVTAVAHGDDRVLNRARVARRTRQRGGAFARVVLRVRDRAPDAGERR
jgi:hypothetical protein